LQCRINRQTPGDDWICRGLHLHLSSFVISFAPKRSVYIGRS
jgi:hypothetical protein